MPQKSSAISAIQIPVVRSITIFASAPIGRLSVNHSEFGQRACSAVDLPQPCFSDSKFRNSSSLQPGFFTRRTAPT